MESYGPLYENILCILCNSQNLLSPIGNGKIQILRFIMIFANNKLFKLYILLISIFILFSPRDCNQFNILFSEELISESEIILKPDSLPQKRALPSTGPVAAENKKVVFLADNLLNGGILSVAEAVKEAANVIGWELIVLDARGNHDEKLATLAKIISIEPDGFILGGVDTYFYIDVLTRIASQGIPIVGWHAGPKPGKIEGTPVAFNVTSDPDMVAKIAADLVVSDSSGKAGVVIFTDPSFAIAMRKADVMKQVIENCEGCTLLSVEKIPLSLTADLMPAVVKKLKKSFVKEWSYSLAINDLYYDFAGAAFVLEEIETGEQIKNISAGDGSVSAFKRIRTNMAQFGTVPEPLRMQGWQLIDELNRLFAGQQPSGYVAPTPLITQINIKDECGDNNYYDAKNGYRQAYRNSWFKTQKAIEKDVKKH